MTLPSFVPMEDTPVLSELFKGSGDSDSDSDSRAAAGWQHKMTDTGERNLKEYMEIRL